MLNQKVQKLSTLIISLFFISSCDGLPHTNPVGPEYQENKTIPYGDTEFIFNLPERGEALVFFDIPFPNELYIKADGTLDLSGFPNPDDNSFLDDTIDLLSSDTNGFGTNTAVYFAFTGPLNQDDLPQSPVESTTSESSVFIIDIEPDSPDQGQRIPIDVRFSREKGKFTPENLLTMLPHMGFPLRGPNTYAAVVTDRVRDDEGLMIKSPPDFEMLKQRQGALDPTLEEMMTRYESFFSYMEDEVGINRRAITAATIFKTSDPTDILFKTREYIFNETPPPEPSGIEASDYYMPYFILYEGTIEVPRFQAGEYPFTDYGSGAFVVDDDGYPIPRGDPYEVRFTIAIPPSDPPDSGFPVRIYAAGSGGDRYSHLHSSHTLLQEGIASISIDPHLHGDRTPEGGDATMLFANAFNFTALKYNPIQAAADYIQVTRLIERLSQGDNGIDEPITLDEDNIFFMGHSNGAFFGSLYLGIEPRVKAAVLSGTPSGVGMYFLVSEESEKYQFLKLLEMAVGTLSEGMDEFHIIINLAQTFFEPSEPLNYASFITIDPPNGVFPKDILMTEGLKDNLVPAISMEAMATAMRLSPVEPVAREIMGLEILGREPLHTPIENNLVDRNGNVFTGGIIQFSEGDHYAAFEDDMERRIADFFKSKLSTGKATIK